jgi:AraC-like DNA-binding protein
MAHQIQIEPVSVDSGQGWCTPRGAWHFFLVVHGEPVCDSLKPHTPLFKGDIVVSHPTAEIRVSNRGYETARANLLSIHPDYLSPLITGARRNALEQMAARNQGQRLLSNRNPSTLSISEILQKRLPSPPQTHSVAIQLVNHLLHQLPVPVGPAVAPASPPNQFSVQFLEERMRQYLDGLDPADLAALGASELAEACQCSPRELSRLLQNQFGCSFTQLKNKLRLKNAEQRLANSNDSVADIAKASGFTQTSALSSIFHRKYGQSPSIWRAQRQTGSRDWGGVDEESGKR